MTCEIGELCGRGHKVKFVLVLNLRCQETVGRRAGLSWLIDVSSSRHRIRVGGQESGVHWRDCFVLGRLDRLEDNDKRHEFI